MTDYPKRRYRRKAEPASQTPVVLEGDIVPADPRSDEPMKVYCVAHNRHGNPCGLSPIRGGTVCHKHGGSAPQVVRAAKLRAQLASDTVMGRLIRIALESPDERAAIVAAKEVLDIADVAKSETTEKPWELMVVSVMGTDEDTGISSHLQERYAAYGERMGEGLPDPEDD